MARLQVAPQHDAGPARRVWRIVGRPARSGLVDGGCLAGHHAVPSRLQRSGQRGRAPGAMHIVPLLASVPMHARIASLHGRVRSLVRRGSRSRAGNCGQLDPGGNHRLNTNVLSYLQATDINDDGMHPESSLPALARSAPRPAGRFSPVCISTGGKATSRIGAWT